MGGFRHDLPTLVQHACEVLVHCLHAREQPLSIVLPGPISLVRKRLHSHLATVGVFFSALFPFRKIARRASLEGTKSLPYCRRTNSEVQVDVTQGPGGPPIYSNLETGRRSPSFEKTVALAMALDVPIGALFSFDQDEADPKTLKRRIETILTKATAQQLKQIYGHARQVMES